MGRDSWRGGTETARSRAPAPHRWVKLLLPPPAPAAGYESSASAAAASNKAARLSARRSASGETVIAGRPNIIILWWLRSRKLTDGGEWLPITGLPASGDDWLLELDGAMAISSTSGNPDELRRCNSASSPRSRLARSMGVNCTRSAMWSTSRSAMGSSSRSFGASPMVGLFGSNPCAPRRRRPSFSDQRGRPRPSLRPNHQNGAFEKMRGIRCTSARMCRAGGHCKNRVRFTLWEMCTFSHT